MERTNLRTEWNDLRLDTSAVENPSGNSQGAHES